MEDLAHTIRRAVREASAARNGLAVAAALNCIEPGDLGDVLPPLAAGRPRRRSPRARGCRPRRGRRADASSSRPTTRSSPATTASAVILVRSETTPDDVLGMQASRGILTARGGLVSHAAVVARGWGIPAVVGASGVHIAGDTVTIGDLVLHAGDEITIDGSSGKIYRRGARHVREPRRPPNSTRCSPGPTPSRSTRSRSAPTPTPPATPGSPGARRTGHRAVSHRAHVPRRRPAADHAAVHPEQ